MTDTLPSNNAAERALLGILLFDNSAFDQVPSGFVGAYFFEGLHQRIYDAMADALSRGVAPEPIMLRERFRHDEAFNAIGGITYLADLIDRAPAANLASGYALVIHDLAMRRGLIGASQAMYESADKDRETPAAQLIEEAEQRLYTLTMGGEQRGLKDFGTGLSAALERAAAAFDKTGEESVGLSTHLTDLNARMGGLQPGHLIILAGSTSMGKTSLATNISFHNASRFGYITRPNGDRATVGGRVAFFSVEMSEEELALRILSERSGISSSRITKGDIEADEFVRLRDAAVEIQDAPFYTDYGKLSLPEIVTRARRMKRTVGLDLIVVDYVQRVDPGPGKFQNRQEKIGHVTAGLKGLATDLGVPVVALAQLSRAIGKRDNPRPNLDDLKDAADIENDADIVLFVHREEYYLAKAKPKEGTAEFLEWEDKMGQCRGMAEVIIGKQRHGRLGSVKVTFNGDLTTFGDVPREPRF